MKHITIVRKRHYTQYRVRKLTRKRLLAMTQVGKGTVITSQPMVIGKYQYTVRAAAWFANMSWNQVDSLIPYSYEVISKQRVSRPLVNWLNFTYNKS